MDPKLFKTFWESLGSLDDVRDAAKKYYPKSMIVCFLGGVIYSFHASESWYVCVSEWHHTMLQDHLRDTDVNISSKVPISNPQKETEREVLRAKVRPSSLRNFRSSLIETGPQVSQWRGHYFHCCLGKVYSSIYLLTSNSFKSHFVPLGILDFRRISWLVSSLRIICEVRWMTRKTPSRRSFSERKSRLTLETRGK